MIFLKLQATAKQIISDLVFYMFLKCSLMQVEQFWHRTKKTKVRRGGKKLDYNVELVIGDLQLAYVNRFLWDITVSQQQERYNLVLIWVFSNLFWVVVPVVHG